MDGEATGHEPGPGPQRTPLWLSAAGGVFVVVIGLVLAASVSRPEPPVYPLTRIETRELPSGFAGPDTVTIDARDGARWTHFEFGRRRVAAAGMPWDIAVKRYRLVVNGGEGLAGEGGVSRIDSAFNDVREAPAAGYRQSRVTPGGDTVSAELDGWYSYSWFSHLLQPRPATFVLRTHDGRYAKLAVLGYYCPGPEPGCLTIEYAYQGDGSRRLAP
jgi:hypothetical protein